MTDAVVVMGDDAEAVAARVVELRAASVRAAGFVGDDRAAAAAMATELFGPTAAVTPLVPST